MSVPCVGDKIKVTRDVYAPPDEYSPAGFYAFKGEILIVRKFIGDSMWVSHEHIEYNSFHILDNEYEILEEC